MNPIIIIPALNPDEKLIHLAEDLKKEGFEIVIIDDGSAYEYKYIFDKLRSDFNCHVCTHANNEGKGNAIKTAIKYAYNNYPGICGYVTADADGRMLFAILLKCANAEKPPRACSGEPEIQR
jgi:glycosyltransferase involved in cell wall biosynthesis